MTNASQEINKLYCFKMTYSNNTITLPCRQTEQSAGFDLYANSNGTILPNTHKLIKTGIGVKIPNNHVGQIWIRSSLSLKYGIEAGAGIIDSDYQGELGVILYNHGLTEFNYTEDTRIAQLLVIPISLPTVVECVDDKEFIKKFTSSERGIGGFGSTGQ
jgi:dUTP pyrophosphatase